MSHVELHPRRPRPAAEALALENLRASLAALTRRHQDRAARLFRAAWARLLEGEGAEATMLTTLGEALTATRLGELDPEGLASLGVAAAVAAQARQRALAAAAAPLDNDLRLALRLHRVPGPAPDRPLPAAILAQDAVAVLRQALLATVAAAEAGHCPTRAFLRAMAEGLEVLPATLPPVLAAEFAAAFAPRTAAPALA